MAYIGNTLSGTTVISVEARKSFALILTFADTNRRPADLTGCTVRFVVKSLPLRDTDTGDSDNLITSSVATLVDPAGGVCQFSVQASELDFPPGEYPFAIVLVTPQGYSSVAVKGVLDLQQNTEFTSMSSTYSATSAPSSIEVLLRGPDTIDVIAGHVIPPGFTWMSDADKVKLDGLDIAGNLLPAGGALGHVLRKRSAVDYDFEWVEPQAYNGTLSAAGQARGRAPVSDGANGWAWGPVPSDTTGVPAGHIPTADAAAGWTWRPPAFGTPASIAAGTDLDTITTTGLYHQNGDNNATLALHYPQLTAGLLEVHTNGGSFVYQRYTGRGTTSTTVGRRVFVRAKYASEAWSERAELAPIGHVHAGTDITTGEVANARLPKLTALRGVTRSTAMPSGGADGDVHLRYL